MVSTTRDLDPSPGWVVSTPGGQHHPGLAATRDLRALITISSNRGMYPGPHQARGLRGCCGAAAAWACAPPADGGKRRAHAHVPAAAFKLEDFAIDHPGLATNFPGGWSGPPRTCEQVLGGWSRPPVTCSTGGWSTPPVGCDEAGPPPWERPVASLIAYFDILQVDQWEDSSMPLNFKL